MENLISIALLLHVLTGMTAFVTGLTAIVARKGNKWHIISGRIYFYSMLIVAVSAIFISIYRENIFLLAIGVFAFYMTWAGFSSIRNKSLKPKLFDWTLLVLGMITAGFMIYTLNTILVVFGGIFAASTIGDLRVFILSSRNKEIPKNQWLVRHIGMMMGSYIATTTAFIVTNIKTFEPAWLPWLLPTILGTPLIVYWTRKVVSKKVTL